MSKRALRGTWFSVFVLGAMLWIVACRATPQPTTAEPTQAPATPTEPAGATDTPSTSVAADPAIGQQLWGSEPCAGCHGANAQGDIGPKLAGTGLSLERVLRQVREGGASMPAFDEEQVTDLELQHIYAWLSSLAAPPTATPTATPTAVLPTATPTETTPAEATPTAAEAAPPTATPTDTATPAPTFTPTPAPAETPSLPAAPDAAVGQQLWAQKPCINCHGANAQGDFGPKLAGTGLSYDQVLLRVRTGKGAMPAFGEDRITDLELQHIYAWLRGLAASPLAPDG